MNINKMINKINMMSDSKARYRLYHSFLYYINFRHNIGKIDIEEFEFFQENIIDNEDLYYQHMKHRYDILEDIYDNLFKLNGLYRPTLKNAVKYPIYDEYYPYYDYDRLITLAEEFLQMMGNDVYNLYLHLIKKELIYEKNNLNAGGQCTNLNGETSGIILNALQSNIFKIVCLVHEIGHAYDNLLNKTSDYIIETQINCEITSIAFEHLFITFLKEKGILEKNLINIIYHNFLVMYLTLMNEALVYNQLILDKKAIPNEPYQIKSQEERKIFQKYSLMHNKNILNNTKEIEPDANYYGVGLLFSFIFMEHFLKNNQEAKKEIKEISQLSQVLNTKEMLNLFPKTEIINAINQRSSKILLKK